MSRKSTDKAKLMVSIVSPDDAQKLTDALSDESRSLHYVFMGKGTAKTNVMEYFGLKGAEKSIVLSVISESKDKKMLAVAAETLKLYLVGKGIAFTLSLTAVSSLIEDAVKVDKPTKGEKMDGKYDLILTAYSSDFSDAVLDAARSAGAVGGTVVNARSLSSAGVEQFAGVKIDEQSEILMILTKRESRNGIMQAVQSVAGLKTKGSGVVLSLPVDSLVGLGATRDSILDMEKDKKKV